MLHTERFRRTSLRPTTRCNSQLLKYVFATPWRPHFVRTLQQLRGGKSARIWIGIGHLDDNQHQELRIFSHSKPFVVAITVASLHAGQINTIFVAKHHCFKDVVTMKQTLCVVLGEDRIDQHNTPLITMCLRDTVGQSNNRISGNHRQHIEKLKWCLRYLQYEKRKSTRTNPSKHTVPRGGWSGVQSQPPQPERHSKGEDRSSNRLQIWFRSLWLDRLCHVDIYRRRAATKADSRN